MKILAIDPSLLSLGWTVMEHTKLAGECNDPPVLCTYGTLCPPKELKAETLAKRIVYILSALSDILEASSRALHDIDTVVIEQPESWGAYKSMASAHSGSLLGLHILTGALLGWAATVADVELIKVSKWKGQLPKVVTKKRMEKKYKTTFKTSDEADAVGLGDYFLCQAKTK